MEMRRGIPLLCQQFTAPLKKNLLLSWRSPRATLSQLFAAFFSRPEVQQLRLLVRRRQGSRRGCSSAESSLRGQDFNFNWIIRLKEFRHPARDHLSAMSLFAPALFLVFSMFGFVLQISALVTEKELKLRQAMSMMGLCESTYWLSWIVSEGILCCSCKKSLPYHTLRVSPLDSQQVLLMDTTVAQFLRILYREEKYGTQCLKQARPCHHFNGSFLWKKRMFLSDRIGIMAKEGRRAAFSIGDIQLGLSTLQENFLTIAREAELETATITVGTRLVGIPGRESPDNPRGIMFEVYWETDDTGSLCISGSVSRNACSSKHPTIDANNCTGEASLAGDDQRPVYGLVIDANQVTQ
ncbi:ABC transporter A family member 2 [Linum perenne]